MMSANAAQWAIHASANRAGPDLTSVGKLVDGTNPPTRMQGQMAEEAVLVGVAMAGIKMAYDGISTQLHELGDQRLAFIKERETGTATFLIPLNKEPRDLSKEETFIKNFVPLILKKSLFSTYSGLHKATSNSIEGHDFYSILPFYRMSENLGHPIENRRPIDQQRRAISWFLKTTVPDFLAHIDRSFQTEWRVTSFFVSTYQGTNYINDLRAARFVIMSLANLLWNIQHPVDPETGYPLSFTDCVKLCRDVEIYLNVLLDSAERETPPYLGHLSHDRDRLIRFVHKIATYTSALRAAYVEEQLNEVNINEVTNSAHQALEIMDQCILNLIYKHRHPIASEDPKNPFSGGVTDGRAAESLVSIFGYLRDLFNINPGLIGFFSSYTKLDPTTTYVNATETTVMDALIIFCHMPKPERLTFIGDLKKSTQSSMIEFADTLEQLHHDFIMPFERTSKRDLKATRYKPKYVERARLTARRLIPFITLVIDDYGVEVDTPNILSRQLESQTNAAACQVLSGKQQIKSINQAAALDQNTGYYQWALSPFLEISAQTAESLNALVKHQYRLTQVTQLLDAVSELIQDYRTFLQLSHFQMFLLNCLNKAKEEYAALATRIDTLDASLSEDERMPRRLKQILSEMTLEMGKRLEGFAQAAINFRGKVGLPNFPDQEKLRLKVKISRVNQQFLDLFGEASGLTDWAPIAVEEDPATTPSRGGSAPLLDRVASSKVVALSQLARRCFDGLSYFSQQGYKGVLLRNLMAKIDHQPDWTDLQLNRAIQQLVCITASYRETYFFQAAYGQTRSAKILIKAIQDPALHDVIPLGSIIFNTTGIDYTSQSEAQIIHALEHLRTNQHWEESASRLSVAGAF